MTSAITDSVSSVESREITKVSASRKVAARASSSTVGSVVGRVSVRSLATYLRGLDPRLSRQVWLVQTGGVVNSFGNGVVFPFIVIYLHNVRGISFAAAGLALSAGAVAALAAGFSAGTVVDRAGGRNTLLLGLRSGNSSWGGDLR